jgi:hypothetical protein
MARFEKSDERVKNPETVDEQRYDSDSSSFGSLPTM